MERADNLYSLFVIAFNFSQLTKYRYCYISHRMVKVGWNQMSETLSLDRYITSPSFY